MSLNTATKMPEWRKLEWGMPVPVDATIAWGARAIYKLETVESRVSNAGRRLRFPQVVNRVTIDLLWDRKCASGDRGEVKALCEWLDTYGIRELKKRCEAEYITTDSDDLIEFEDRGYKLRASPSGSYGYLYISAWKVG